MTAVTRLRRDVTRTSSRGAPASSGRIARSVWQSACARRDGIATMSDARLSPTVCSSPSSCRRRRPTVVCGSRRAPSPASDAIEPVRARSRGVSRHMRDASAGAMAGGASDAATRADASSRAATTCSDIASCVDLAGRPVDWHLDPVNGARRPMLLGRRSVPRSADRRPQSHLGAESSSALAAPRPGAVADR